MEWRQVVKSRPPNRGRPNKLKKLKARWSNAGAARMSSDYFSTNTWLSLAIRVCIVFGGETSRICELFIDVSPPFLRVEMEGGLL